MTRLLAFLALSISLVACTATQKPAPSAPLAKPMPVVPLPSIPPSPSPDSDPAKKPTPSSPKPPQPPPGPKVDLVLHPASPLWTQDALTDEDRAAHVLTKLHNLGTQAWYVVIFIPVPSSIDIEGYAKHMRLQAAMNDADTSDITYMPDGKGAWFWYEHLGSEARGKAFLYLKPGLPGGLLVQSLWPLDNQRSTVPDVDAMNASLDYSIAK